MARGHRRKCWGCRRLFRPDPRNLRHQRYCSELFCRAAGTYLVGRRPLIGTDQTSWRIGAFRLGWRTGSMRAKTHNASRNRVKT
jgi:hypothetical protein